MAVLKERKLRESAWFEQEPWGAFWERGYRDANVSTMGGPSHEIVELIAALPPGGKTLDLGCGEGRNTLFLAGRGFDTTAIDRSEAGIEKLRHVAAQAGLKVSGLVADIVNVELVETYDLVMAHGVLYYLSNMEWRDLLQQVKERTRPGGANAYSVFIFNDEYPRPSEFKSARYTHSLAPGELRDFYSDWEILRHDVYVKWDQHPGIPLHCHPIEKLVARKPGGDGPPAVIEPVPTGAEDMKRESFHCIPMGMPVNELRDLCGEPDVIDTYTLDGLQMGAVSPIVNGYNLSLWFYGKTVIYVANGQVWGRALYSSQPVRVHFKR